MLVGDADTNAMELTAGLVTVTPDVELAAFRVICLEMERDPTVTVNVTAVSACTAVVVK
jgi:hypothetical protein